MSSNVGLSTPRGSGTSGYVQKNNAFLKPRSAGYGAPYPPPSSDRAAGEGGFRQRQPDRQILLHDRKRAIEVQVLEERERLEADDETPLTDDAIEERCDALRRRLLKELEEGSESGGGDRRGGQRRPERPDNNRRQQFKSYQVHELAEAKMLESERLREALGIRKNWETGVKRNGSSAAAAGAAYLEKEKDQGRRSDRDRDRESERDYRRDDSRGIRD